MFENIPIQPTLATDKQREKQQLRFSNIDIYQLKCMVTHLHSIFVLHLHLNLNVGIYL